MCDFHKKILKKFVNIKKLIIFVYEIVTHMFNFKIVNYEQF